MNVERLLLIAGRGAFPRELAENARRLGVQYLHVIAFRGETERAVVRAADSVSWVPVGPLQPFLAAVEAAGIPDAALAGQISPWSLFRARPDRPMLELLNSLPAKNARTIFGSVIRLLEQRGIRVHPAEYFMGPAMPEPGLLTPRAPDEREAADLALGRAIAKTCSGLEIGQTVVVKNGVVLAVEAFEGTDAAILRGGRLGGPGAVVVKTPRRGHDMRYDVPVVGPRTIRVLRRARATALAVEARRTIILERAKTLAAAHRINLAWIAWEPEQLNP